MDLWNSTCFEIKEPKIWWKILRELIKPNLIDLFVQLWMNLVPVRLDFCLDRFSGVQMTFGIWWTQFPYLQQIIERTHVIHEKTFAVIKPRHPQKICCWTDRWRSARAELQRSEAVWWSKINEGPKMKEETKRILQVSILRKSNAN